MITWGECLLQHEIAASAINTHSETQLEALESSGFETSLAIARWHACWVLLLLPWVGKLETEEQLGRCRGGSSKRRHQARSEEAEQPEQVAAPQLSDQDNPELAKVCQWPCAKSIHP